MALPGLCSSGIPVKLQDAVGQDTAGRVQTLGCEQRQQVAGVLLDLLGLQSAVDQKVEVGNVEVAQNIRFIKSLMFTYTYTLFSYMFFGVIGNSRVSYGNSEK